MSPMGMSSTVANLPCEATRFPIVGRTIDENIRENPGTIDKAMDATSESHGFPPKGEGASLGGKVGL